MLRLFLAVFIHCSGINVIAVQVWSMIEPFPTTGGISPPGLPLLPPPHPTKFIAIKHTKMTKKQNRIFFMISPHLFANITNKQYLPQIDIILYLIEKIFNYVKFGTHKVDNSESYLTLKTREIEENVLDVEGRILNLEETSLKNEEMIRQDEETILNLEELTLKNEEATHNLEETSRNIAEAILQVEENTLKNEEIILNNEKTIL